MEFRYIKTNGIQLHAAIAGPEDGKPIFLLHGFPEPWFGWERQIAPLADAGFRVVVPDQRGYNLSDKPTGHEHYRQEVLVEDVIGLIDAFGYERINLAGHDFGAMVSWNVARRYPDRLKKLCVANVPHPAIARRFLQRKPSQMLKSWYAAFFQIPKLPEMAIRAGNWRAGIDSLPKYFSNDRQDRYREAWGRPGAMTSMLNWYRAMARGLTAPMDEHPIRVPTLMIWGKQDRFLSFDMAPLSVALCEYGRLETFEDATHWVQHDKAAEVSALLIEHFTED